MPDFFYHETLYRGQDTLTRLGEVQLVLCGAGAVGSNLANNLLRQGYQQLTVIDFDRIEAHNIGTQLYGESDIGAFKAEALQAEMFRAVGVEITAVTKRLTPRNIAKLLHHADLVIDGFDNHASRKLVTDFATTQNLACLHVGLNADYAQVHWNETYRVPQDPDMGALDACDYPLARNLVLFATTIASEAILRYALTGEKQNYSFTLGDLKINRE